MMDAYVVTKAACGLLSVIAAGFSCAYWYRSSKAEVLWDDRLDDDIGFTIAGKEIAFAATAKKQSALGAKGAGCAAIAAGLQLIPLAVDFWLTICAPKC